MMAPDASTAAISSLLLVRNRLLHNAVFEGICKLNEMACISTAVMLSVREPQELSMLMKQVKSEAVAMVIKRLCSAC